MSTELATQGGLTIRVLVDADRAAVARLAERDGVAAPEGSLLGAELDDRLVAVVPIGDDTAAPIADPFTPTASIVRLLRMRTAHLRADGRRPRRFFWAARLSRRGRARSRGALAGSPPGGGGRLLRL
jgi:hypothetical protein